MFPALPASAIADALGKAAGDVQQAANALFAEQVDMRLEFLLVLTCFESTLGYSTAVRVGSIILCREWQRGCFPSPRCDVHILQEAAAVANNKHKEESSAKPKAVVDETASSSAAAASAAANTGTTATPRRVREWSVGDVCAFFTEQKLGEYNAAIAENEVDGRMLQDLLAEDGLGELGIKSKIHLLRIKRGLEKAEDRSKDTCGNAVVRLLCFASVLSRTAMLLAALSCSSSRSARPSTSVRTTTRRARSRTRTTRCSRR